MEPQPYERRRRGLGWLWPILALLLLLVLIVLLVRACGDGDGDEGAAAGTGTAQVETSGEGGGSVDFDELAGASGGSLARWAGREVDVADAGVLSVVEDAGFWIGSADDERVFVEVEDETGLDELGLEEGDAVSFTGTVEENVEAETYGLRGDDATLFRRQGAHIRVQAAEIERS